jgi:hypothetical protein
MSTVLVIPVAAGIPQLSQSRNSLNVRVCFQFISNDQGLPDFLRSWPDTVSKLGLKVDLYRESSLDTSVGSGLWPGIEKKEQAHSLWSSMIGRAVSADASMTDELRWVPSKVRSNDNREFRTYSVKHLLTAWQKTKTKQMLDATGIKTKEPISLTERELNAHKAFWSFHKSPKQINGEAIEEDSGDGVSVSDLALFATQHPTLAKRVGLVCDVSIKIPTGFTASDKLLLRATVQDKTMRTPFVACALRETSKTKVFLTRSAAGDDSYVGGLGGVLRMRKLTNGGAFTPIYYLETLDYVASLHREEVTRDVATATGTMQREITTGLALIRDGIEHIKDGDRFGKVTLPNGQEEFVLYAAALVYGYRVDVRKSGTWLPLCNRRVKYIAGNVEWEAVDEGMISPSPVTDDGNGAQKHEEVLRWTTSGSLVSAQPGKMANGDETPATSFGALVYKIALPTAALACCRLRYEYLIRMRCVFAGGYSLDMGEVETAGLATGEDVTEPHRYRRSESVVAPTVVTDPDKPGICNLPTEEADRVNEHRIICSRDIKNGKRAIRFIHPPSVTEEDVILMGELDSMKPEDSYRLLAHYADLVQGSAGDPRGLPDPDAIGALFRFRLRGKNTIAGFKCPADQTETPLTPGCEARGSLSFYQGKRTWPRVRPIRFEVQAIDHGSSAVSFNPKSGHVRVSLAPGATVDCDISCIPRTSEIQSIEKSTTQHLNSLAHDYLVPNAIVLALGYESSLLSSSQISSLSAIDTGASSEITIALKHATRKPVGDPFWGAPVVKRDLGANLAVIQDSPVFDRETTGKLSLTYTWDELSCMDVSGGIVKVKKIGNSEEIDVGQDLLPAKNQPHTDSDQLDFRLLFNDTKARDITARIVAEGQFPDCFAPSKNSERQTQSAEAKFVIPNSAIPSPPVVRFALPLTSLDRTSEDSVRQSVRKGNAIRIYVDGCWCETGRGELLGIVCAPNSQAAVSDAERRKNEPFFSQWGAEILLKTTPMADGPHVHHFDWATAFFDGVNAFTPDELKKGIIGDRPAIVAGHGVKYDLITKGWYSDISVSMARRSYLPWIRFGLVRFQPDSIQGCHVSPVTLSTFCQFLPDRTVTVVRSQSDPRRVRISVAGIGAVSDGENDRRLRSVLEVSVLTLPDHKTGFGQEAHLDEEGKVWVESAAAHLPWHAREDGNGAYIGDLWLPDNPSESQTRFIIKEVLKSSLPGSDGSGRPILLESVKI